MQIPTKVTALTVILAIVATIITEEISHNVALSALVLLTIGLFPPLFAAQRLGRRR